jgi:hypothetical protein
MKARWIKDLAYSFCSFPPGVERLFGMSLVFQQPDKKGRT